MAAAQSWGLLGAGFPDRGRGSRVRAQSATSQAGPLPAWEWIWNSIRAPGDAAPGPCLGSRSRPSPFCRARRPDIAGSEERLTTGAFADCDQTIGSCGEIRLPTATKVPTLKGLPAPAL